MSQDHTEASKHEGAPLAPSKPERRRRNPWKVSGGILGGLLVLGALCIVLGYLYIGIKTPEQQVQLATHVCGTAMVDTYNKIGFPLNDSDKATLKSLSKQIKETKESETDPTCQSIVFMAAYRDYDIDTMQAALNRINTAHAKGIYADSSLTIGLTPDAMSSLMSDVKEK